jgi:FkbM family methyltransferase
MNFRKAAERLSRGIVLTRRLPAAFQRLPIYVSPEASLRYWLGMSRVDAMLYRMARELVKPGASVWDVGANVGLFSFCAAALAGPSGFVLAIEPDVWLSHLINRSSWRWKQMRAAAAPVSAVCAAISDRTQVSDLQISERSRAASHLSESRGSTQFDGGRFSQPAISVPLDFLLDYFPAPTVLKIDVETHETRVLQGARRLLETVRPVIWCEVSPENSKPVFDILEPLGYDLYAAAATERVPLNRASWDTLAVPKPEARAESPVLVSKPA